MSHTGNHSAPAAPQPGARKPGKGPQFWALLLWARWPLAVLATLAVFGLSSIPIRQPRAIYRLDKLVHTVEYLALGLVYINLATAAFRRFTWLRVLGPWAVMLAVALADERYQSLIPGRRSDLADVVADAAGGLLAVALAWWLHRRQLAVLS